MTIVASWLNQESVEPQLWVVTDTVYSKKNHLDEDVPLIDYGAKLFSIPVNCYTKQGLNNQLYFSTNIGLAFAGSSLIALTLYAVLNHTLRALINYKIKITKPSVFEIALHGAKILEKLLNQYSETNFNKPPPCEITIFGYCPVDNQPNLFHIFPEANHCTITQIPLTEAYAVHFLGDHKVEIQEKILQYRQVEQNKSNINRAPLLVIEEIIAKELYPTIGGGVQLGITNKINGFKLILRPKPGNKGTTLFLQNIDIFEDQRLYSVGNFLVDVTGLE